MIARLLKVSARAQGVCINRAPSLRLWRRATVDHVYVDAKYPVQVLGAGNRNNLATLMVISS